MRALVNWLCPRDSTPNQSPDGTGALVSCALAWVRWVCLYPILGAALLHALFTPAAAAEFHVCDCAASADSDCQPGNDSATGQLAQPWRSVTRARQGFISMAAGDAIRFCAGGHWQIDASSTGAWVNAVCRAEQACVVGAYVAPWASGDEAAPRLERLNAVPVFDLADGGNANHEAGYRFQDLTLQGVGGFAFFLYNDIDDVTLSRLDISGFDIAVHVAGSNACDTSDPLCDGRNERIVLHDSQIHDNHHQGWLGGSTGSQILRNAFARNGSTAVFDHNIYASGHTQDMRIAGNTLVQSTPDANGRCTATSLVVHGYHVDMRIEDNEVRELPTLAGEGCWGISAIPGYGPSSGQEGFDGLVVRGNRVYDVGNVAISVGACRQCVVENNLVVQSQAISTRGIALSPLVPTPEDLTDLAITVRNNTIYFATNLSHTGIDVRAGSGENAVLVSNAIQFDGSSGTFDCLALGQPWSGYAVIDANQCGSTLAPQAEWTAGLGSTPDPLTAWQLASGWDLHSAWGDPGFADRASLTLQGFQLTAGSAARDQGDPLLSSPDDLLGQARDALPDVGALEYQSVISVAVFADGFE